MKTINTVLVFVLTVYSIFVTFCMFTFYQREGYYDLSTPTSFSSAVYLNNTSWSNSSESSYSVKEEAPRILCLVLTYPGNHKTKAMTVKKTWGKRCDTLLFASSQYDSELPTVAVISEEDNRDKLWRKTQATFKLIYEQYLDKADWFFKADDDTFVIMENLRYLLKGYKTSDPLLFGQRLLEPVGTKKMFMSGGAGYVISKEALKRLVEKALPANYFDCSPDLDGSGEDLYIANCLKHVDVTFVDTADASERERFHAYNFETIISGKLVEAFQSFLTHPYRPGLNCCAEALISFHYVTPIQMEILEFLLYHVTIYGLHTKWKWNGPESILQIPAVNGSDLSAQSAIY